MRVTTVPATPEGIAQATKDLGHLVARQAARQEAYKDATANLDAAILEALDEKGLTIEGLSINYNNQGTTLHARGCRMARLYGDRVTSATVIRGHVTDTLTTLESRLQVVPSRGGSTFYKIHSCVLTEAHRDALVPLAVAQRQASRDRISEGDVEDLRLAIARAQKALEAPREAEKALAAAEKVLVATLGERVTSITEAHFDIVAAYVDAHREVAKVTPAG